MSLVMMDKFKEQDNNDLIELGVKCNCEIVIISHNLTNEFQALDLSARKAARPYVFEKYNSWMANEFLK